MTINHATSMIKNLINNSSGSKKANYVSLLDLIAAGNFSLDDSKKDIRRLNFRNSFIENIEFLISIQDEHSYHYIRIYRTKHGTPSLIDVSRLGKGPRQTRRNPHSSNC